MKIRKRVRLLVFAATLATGLLLCEIAVRVLSRSDADGNSWFYGLQLKPYRMPVATATGILDRYGAGEQTALVYDARLGWNQRPGVSGHNAQGFISTNPDVSPEPAPGRWRIALFGGSFTQGGVQGGWWNRLEAALKRDGIDAEILNFGVSAYGMDQAWLRWKYEGAAYHPHVVIFGFCPVNCFENVNILRLARDPESGVPFLKPRFIMQGDELQLIDSPTPGLQQVRAIISDYANWPLSRYDYTFNPQDYVSKPWRLSRLTALLEAKIAAQSPRARRAQDFSLDHEPAQLALRINAEFRREVETSGSRFAIVHLPTEPHLDAIREGHSPYAELYEALRKQQTVISPEQAMISAAQAGPPGTAFVRGHHGPALQDAIAETVAKELRTWKRP